MIVFYSTPGGKSMRAVVQRVDGASVEINGVTHAKIGRGLMILVGVEKNDTEKDADFLAGKCAGLRIFEDEDGMMNLSATELNLEALVVSQFTLLGDVRKGRRPGFDLAMEPSMAETMIERFYSSLAGAGIKTSKGVFRTHMKVALVNDGPVTILLDSKKIF